ncbi:dipeptide epimerase [Saccharopolyspora flava]|uniref:Dipeptide epimerase n=1 Tax=Saccharopolyspora flava TaxID=95161 RepID=A0A1I6NSS9_9PSEU|nr:dipeptide epimerase [Saccharopolyspora flava]SFS31056.1 L-alanine-DL-glutamate epimerase [Saccharopolyspora flava]
MRLEWRVGGLALREPLRISRSVMAERAAVTVTVEHDGVVGHGEAVTSVHYGLDVERIECELAAAREVLAPLEPAEALVTGIAAAPGVRCAVDAALHDLLARSRGVAVHELLGTTPHRPVPTARTIGITSTHRAVADACDLTSRGFRLLKVKVGAEPPELDRVAAIRHALPDVRLLLDPNGAWTPEQAPDLLRTAAGLGVDAVEQPIAPGTPDVLAAVAADSPVPVIADEDARTAEDVRALGSGVHGINIKLPECGGLRAARELVDVAREFGVDVMLGCQVASSLGIAPAVHLAGQARWVDLDGHLLLARDPWTGIGGEDGLLRIDGPVGLGVRPV